MINIVFKKPNEKPCKMSIDNKLEKFQELVDGFIEIVPLNQQETILMIINEEGKLRNLQPNVYMKNDCIVGNIIFVQNKFDEEFHSLTDDMVNIIIKQFS